MVLIVARSGVCRGFECQCLNLATDWVPGISNWVTCVSHLSRPRNSLLLQQWLPIIMATTAYYDDYDWMLFHIMMQLFIVY